MSKKSTDIVVKKRVNIIKKMLIQGTKSKDLYLYTSKEWGVSTRQTETYISRAKKLMNYNQVSPTYKNNTCYVYIISCDGFYKIGISTNPENRLKQICTCNPHKVSLVYKKEGTDKQCRKTELTLHKIFKNSNKKKEWFVLNSSDINKAKKIIKLALNKGEK